MFIYLLIYLCIYLIIPESVWAKGSSNSGGLPNMFTSSHLLIFTSSHLHIFLSSHLLIFTPSHLHIFTSFTSSHLHIFSSLHLLIFTSSHLCTSSHPHILTFSHLTSSHLLIFTSSHLPILTFSLALLLSCPLSLLPSCSFLLPYFSLKAGCSRWHRSLCVAGVALGDIELPHFVWQEWHLVTLTRILRGRRGTCDTGLALVARLVPGDAAPLCVGGVALGDIDVHSALQAWHFSFCKACFACGHTTHTYTHTHIHTQIHTYRLTSNSLTRKSFIRTFHHLMSLSCLSHSVFTLLFCDLLEEVDMWRDPILSLSHSAPLPEVCALQDFIFFFTVFLSKMQIWAYSGRSKKWGQRALPHDRKCPWTLAQNKHNRTEQYIYIFYVCMLWPNRFSLCNIFVEHCTAWRAKGKPSHACLALLCYIL